MYAEYTRPQLTFPALHPWLLQSQGRDQLILVMMLKSYFSTFNDPKNSKPWCLFTFWQVFGYQNDLILVQFYIQFYIACFYSFLCWFLYYSFDFPIWIWNLNADLFCMSGLKILMFYFLGPFNLKSENLINFIYLSHKL